MADPVPALAPGADGAEAPRATRLPAFLAGPLARLRENPLLSRALLPALGVAALVLAAMLWLLFAPAERTALFRNLPDADKAAVFAALEANGLDVALDPKSGAVLLPPQDHARARMLLAAEGLPKAAPGALDMLGDMPLGTSRAVEAAKIRKAGEQELARAIETLDGVERARVILAVPEPSPFVRERPEPKASVTVTLARGRSLSAEETRAIAHLVAGAVPGLAADSVAIADQTGRLLAGGPGSASQTALARRLELQLRMEQRARDAILALLGPIVGPEALTAEVAIELDLSTREAATERFDRDGALRSESLSSSTATEPRAIGIPGALTNTTPAAPQMTAQAPPPATGPTESTTRSESATRNYELGRSVEVMANAGGTIRRMTAAVVIRDDALGPPAQRAAMLRQMEALVQGAIGYDQARGDRVTVVARPFAPPAVETVPVWREPLVIEGAKWLAAALVAVAILLFVVRPLLAKWPREAPAPQRPRPVETAIRLEPRVIDYSAKLTEARLLASTDAARATAVARRLLAEEDV
ncbi:flagellar basal-body MS-ring/collar protein FliF [Thermaurantiacus tibetensis]|uniref:flagellar basal-body MS-ring/collar protein FliF n=1 Tax=Thermaurantiacus tibetensis TaxID=2759035 RepID=UPI001890758A|nr:flagellar basal-body MS-ring/collar protein FliF [Thermaurantiacus tibetensis]